MASRPSCPTHTCVCFFWVPVCWPFLISLLLHVVQRDELTPGIPSSDYEGRRKKLMELLPEKSVVVSVAAPVKYMSGSEYSQSFEGGTTAEYILTDILWVFHTIHGMLLTENKL